MFETGRNILMSFENWTAFGLQTYACVRQSKIRSILSALSLRPTHNCSSYSKCREREFFEPTMITKDDETVLKHCDIFPLPAFDEMAAMLKRMLARHPERTFHSWRPNLGAYVKSFTDFPHSASSSGYTTTNSRNVEIFRQC